MIGVVLMVALTLVLASVFAAGVGTFGEGLNDAERQYDAAATNDETTTITGNPWSGSRGDLIRISDTRAGATDVTYRVNFTIKPDSGAVGDSVESIYLEVTTGSPDMFSSTELADLDMAGIDEGSDGTIDQHISDDAEGWSVQESGSALEIGFSTDYTVGANDSIIIIFDGVSNPETAGEYDVFVETSDGTRHDGTITIVE